jgi:nitrate reductase NapE component
MAADALGHFRRKVERDQRFVIAAFWLMCIVAVAVVARRVGVVWVVQSATGFTRKLLSSEKDSSQEL